ncbi:uncharacterized protein LOC126908585 [Daktulosphaira vitifoliae]|uniref:uncharacterized protein LOC126908585 n=1 Tax=Daktulosphaira vitifoliae TaxID=58002 RepID=UPI0021AA7BD0|nr:uncharacterized protein LOC126908585 [Daktulosphaira vitifoliae]
MRCRLDYSRDSNRLRTFCFSLMLSRRYFSSKIIKINNFLINNTSRSLNTMTSFRRWWCVILSVFFVAAVATRPCHTATIKFDQSQTGDYNLQIHLKNIELYAVFDDSAAGDEDYADLPDYTDPSSLGPSKPNSTSSTPVTSSTQNSYSTTSPTTTFTSATDLFGPANSEKIVQMVEALIASNGNASASETYESSPATTTSAMTTAVTPGAQSSSNTSNRKCGPGYFRDPMGRCRRIRKPHLPFLQMVHTPGVIKSFQPQQRQSDESNFTESIN